VAERVALVAEARNEQRRISPLFRLRQIVCTYGAALPDKPHRGLPAGQRASIPRDTHKQP